jgi:putative MATE family efflux protein
METLDLAAPAFALGGNRYKAILRLALPTVFAMLSQSVVNEVDVVFFSHLPVPESSNAQAALLPSLILVWLFGGCLGAISVGTQALVARRYAEGNRHAAGAVLANAGFFCIVASLVLSVVGLVCLPYLVNSMIEVPQVREVAISYTRLRLIGLVSMSTTMAMKAFFDGVGRTHVHLVAAVVMNIINVILCWVFVFGEFGAPRMGATGAGLAAFLATWIGTGIMVGYVALLRREYHPVRWSNISWPLTWSIVKLSLPAAAATAIMMVGFSRFVWIAGKLDENGGPEAIYGAANTIIVEVLKLTFTACMAFGTATATLIAQSLGRKQPDEAMRWGWASVRLGIVIFGVVGLCEGVLFTHQLVEFISNSRAVQAEAIFPLRIMAVATPLIAVAMILTEGLFGAGNTRFVAMAQFLLIFAWLVPGAYLLGIVLHMSLRGIWISSFVYACLAAAVLSAKFAGGSWKTIKL